MRTRSSPPVWLRCCTTASQCSPTYVDLDASATEAVSESHPCGKSRLSDRRQDLLRFRLNEGRHHCDPPAVWGLDELVDELLGRRAVVGPADLGPGAVTDFGDRPESSGDALDEVNRGNALLVRGELPVEITYVMVADWLADHVPAQAVSEEAHKTGCIRIEGSEQARHRVHCPAGQVEWTQLPA